MQFDHLCKYTSLKKYSSVKVSGLFIDSEDVVMHPPKNKCRFVKFDNGYLEFIDNGSQLKMFLGIVPPGLYFSSEEPFVDIAKRLEHLGPRISFRPYEWKQKNNGPGWHFMSFTKEIFSGINIIS